MINLAGNVVRDRNIIYLRKMTELKFRQCIATILIMGFTLPPAVADSDSQLVNENQLAINRLIEKYQNQCDNAQKNFRDIDSDVDAPLQGKLTLSEDAIYQVIIHGSGKTSLVLYPEFQCENIGYAWCGTGGCGFYLAVDGRIFHRQIGFRPQSAQLPEVFGDLVLLAYPLHGTSCLTAQGQAGTGTDPCVGIAIWDDRHDTFNSLDGKILDMNPMLP